MPQLITYGLATYSNDQRFQIFHEPPNDWKLQIQFPKLSDEGVYECQVATSEANIFKRIRLSVVGKENLHY